MNKLPTINIKGKEYVLVKDRIIAFHEEYKNGSIQTELITSPDSKLIIVKAKVIPDSKQPERFFTAYSQAIVGGNGVNSTSALENAETSAVGRAMAMLGIGVLESVASADEIHKTAFVTNGTNNSAPTTASIDPKDLPPCLGCGRGRKFVPAGVNKAGKAFKGFYPCESNKEQQTPECRKNIIWEEMAEDVALNYRMPRKEIHDLPADWDPNSGLNN